MDRCALCLSFSSRSATFVKDVAGPWPTASPRLAPITSPSKIRGLALNGKLPCLTTAPGLPCTRGPQDAWLAGKYFILQSVSLCRMFSDLHWIGLLASTSGNPCKRSLQGICPSSTA
ncbi:uncharacterized protein LOC115044583 isoform X2 [Echeneis naucrates]|uniref:uncharacterized protein LOC115044583 isoform X2 n=1 Tax=Echeneis naucrates TaxID=173247 RepID=UPI0011135AB5|nr:uncharacterized protein LOC115044583 isoform X2 [Echeneis naucrates]